MQASLETLSNLERRLKVAVPMDQINNEVDTRLKRLQRTVKLHGFRPGKVPFKVVAQQYGLQVRQEVLGDTVERTFGEAVTPLTAFFAGFVTLLNYYLWVWIGSLLTQNRWLTRLI